MYTKQKFAAKVSSKTRLVLKGAVGQALRERKFLIDIEHDFIVNLRYSFQDKDSLYLIQEHMPGGDLGYH
jgi:serine/threonine protein kinase